MNVVSLFTNLEQSISFMINIGGNLREHDLSAVDGNSLGGLKKNSGGRLAFIVIHLDLACSA